MKILLIGSNGQLGWELCRKAPGQGLDVVPLDLPDFDITEPSQVRSIVTQPDISFVVHPANAGVSSCRK